MYLLDNNEIITKEEKEKFMSIGFWKKESGNSLTHGKGLTVEHIEFLKTLKEGDRLIIWDNKPKEGETKPHFTLKKFLKKEG